MERLVEFSNRAGRTLRGMIHQPDNIARGAAPGVVLLHGFAGDRMESHWIFVKCSRALQQAGIGSLRFDFFGSGESDGEFREASIESEMADADEGVAFLRREGGVNPARVGLLGFSLGGGIAALVAERLSMRALVLWAAVAHLTELRALAKAYMRPLPGNSDLREYSGHIVSDRFLDSIDRLNPLASAACFTQPTLIIHPERDEFLGLHHPEDYFRASGAALKEKVIVSGADHTFSSIRCESDVIARTVRWFRENLGDEAFRERRAGAPPAR